MSINVDTLTKYISLYSGVGGLDLGFNLAVPSARAICYVEREASAISTLVKHMQTGALDDAPIWTDSATFDGKPWCGKVDWVIGGFPCQPSSLAGNRGGVEDERWLWPDIRRIVLETGAQGVFLENVPGLLSVNDGGAFEKILGDLAVLGFNVEWSLFKAASVGAPHRRSRIFILATHSERSRQPRSWRYRYALDKEENPYREADRFVDAVQGGSWPFVCRSHDGM